VAVHQLSRTRARQIAIQAQLLDRERQTDLVDVVGHLFHLQNDPTAVVAPSAEIVLWSRLGDGYRSSELATCLEDRTFVELRGMIRPAEDLALYTAEMAGWPETAGAPEWHMARAEWLDANDEFRRYLLYRLEDEGPLTWRDIPDRSEVPWKSSGWNDNRNVRMMIESLEQRGEVAAAGKRGRDRLWDLAERVYPNVAPVPLEQALRTRAERRLRSLGIARAKDPEYPNEPTADVGEPAEVDGTRGRWRVDPWFLDQDFSGRTAVLSPLDRLVYDRKRMVDLFEFDYQLEMYKPAPQRRWGYYALPVLHGDRLIGKVDATAERQIGVLRVDAIHEDEAFAKSVARAVHDEIVALAEWLELDLVLPA